MTSVKMNNKEIVEKLKEALELIIEKKLSDQEILNKISTTDLLARLNDRDVLNNLSELTDALIKTVIVKNDEIPNLTDEKRKRIFARASNYRDYHENKSDDELLYDLKED